MPAGEDLPRLEIRSRDELRAWLEANHAQPGSVWLVTHKKARRRRPCPLRRGGRGAARLRLGRQPAAQARRRALDARSFRRAGRQRLVRRNKARVAGWRRRTAWRRARPSRRRRWTAPASTRSRRSRSRRPCRRARSRAPGRGESFAAFPARRAAASEWNCAGEDTTSEGSPHADRREFDEGEVVGVVLLQRVAMARSVQLCRGRFDPVAVGRSCRRARAVVVRSGGGLIAATAPRSASVRRRPRASVTTWIFVVSPLR